MFKILIKDNTRIIKQKIYQTEKSFKQWKPKMIAKYSRVYNIECYEFIDNKWKLLDK